MTPELLEAVKRRSLSAQQWAVIEQMVRERIPAVITPEERLRIHKRNLKWEAADRAGFKGGHARDMASPFGDGYRPPLDEFAAIDALGLDAITPSGE